jgi:hypothetical protein
MRLFTFRSFAFLAFALLTGLNSVYAADSLSTKITHHYDSMRALGMGNAFTAVADDYSLIYYNPAGFANKKANEVQFSLVGAGVSPKTTKLVDDIKKASDIQGTDAAKAQAISDVLDEYYGKSLGGKVQALEMFWVRKNWGVSLIPVDLSIDMSINRQLGPAIDLNVKGDTTVAYGYGKEVAKYLAVGATAKFVHRISVEQSVSALELASNSDILSSKRFKEGNLVDFDLGVMWTPAWFGHTIVKEEKPDGLKVESKLPSAADEKKEEKREPQAENELDQAEKEIAGNAKKEETKKEEKPVVKEIYKDKLPLTLGLVVHNVLGGSFSQSKMINKDATDVPTKMYRVVDVGSQYVISEIGDLTIRSMLDFRDLMHPEITFNKSFHAGLEFDYSPSGWFKSQLRGGVNQMYYTAGATLLLGVLNIDFVTYGEEVGTTSEKLENRVYAAKVGFNF